MKTPNIRLGHVAICVAGLITANVAVSVLWWGGAVRQYPPIDTALFCSEQRKPVGIVLFYADDDMFRSERLSATDNAAQRCPKARIFAVGGARPHRHYFGAEAMAAWLEARGIERSRILIDHQSFDTRGNVDAAIDIAHRTDISTLILVSDPLHFGRIDYLFRRRDPTLSLEHNPSGNDASLARIVNRANYEGAAWLLEFVPSSLRMVVLSWLRRTK